MSKFFPTIKLIGLFGLAFGVGLTACRLWVAVHGPQPAANTQGLLQASKLTPSEKNERNSGVASLHDHGDLTASLFAAEVMSISQQNELFNQRKFEEYLRNAAASGDSNNLHGLVEKCFETDAPRTIAALNELRAVLRRHSINPVSFQSKWLDADYPAAADWMNNSKLGAGDTLRSLIGSSNHWGKAAELLLSGVHDEHSAAYVEMFAEKAENQNWQGLESWILSFPGEGRLIERDSSAPRLSTIA